jgi:hypothetical protein
MTTDEVQRPLRRLPKSSIQLVAGARINPRGILCERSAIPDSEYTALLMLTERSGIRLARQRRVG